MWNLEISFKQIKHLKISVYIKSKLLPKIADCKTKLKYFARISQIKKAVNVTSKIIVFDAVYHDSKCNPNTWKEKEIVTFSY